MCGIFAAILKNDKNSKQNAISFDVNSPHFLPLKNRGPDINHSQTITINQNYKLFLAGWTLNLRADNDNPTKMPVVNQNFSSSSSFSTSSLLFNGEIYNEKYFTDECSDTMVLSRELEGKGDDLIVQFWGC